MYRPNDVLINGQRLSNVFNAQDEDWHTKYMRPIRGFWTMTKVLDYEPLIDETLVKFMERLGKEFAEGENDGKSCPGDDWLGYFAWDVTANISFGRHYGFIDQGKDVNNLIVDSTKGLYYFAPVSQIPWIDRLLDKNPFVRIGPKPTLTGVMYAFQVVAQYQAERAEGKNQAPVANSLDRYLRLKEEYPDIVNDAQVVNWLMLNVLAGGDTTSATMRAVVYYLSKNPKAYEKLMQELDSTKLSFPAQWKEIKDLPYLDAVMREALRINPGIAMIFERVVPKGGFTLPDGRYIPAGTKVGMNPAVTNRNLDVFGEDANEFNPDRWLPKEGELPQAFDIRLRRMREVADFVFGGGGRVCMGRYLATLEIYKLFATLYSTFDMRLADPKHEWTYRNAWFVYQYDMPCIVKRRQKAVMA
ncbi:hypothetical protein LTR70_005929 [Exophiala xenobiotica]|uniref:Cytochrome P450 n=1 Tax=Lithohypha guttulata TaxID=1690604 RepID=A0ABR0K719_9EURO|nr:hypothetical protein LTR24_006089 [Lithohypha guttulata]KAK5317311.1 hypothetical protein LTR70_005929 [Exophiala xenobiotica]